MKANFVALCAALFSYSAMAAGQGTPVQAGQESSGLVVDAQPGAARAKAVAPSVKFDSCEKPVYPSASLPNNEKGEVRMAFLISRTGNVLDSKVLKSSGFSALDTAALTALAKCEFTPRRFNGEVAEGWVQVNYVWQLE